MLATLLVSAPLLAPATLPDDGVWVIDPAGGGDFVEIADALPVTGEGWMLLVRPGTYSAPVVIANQGLTLVADGTGPVVLTEPLLVSGLGKTRDLIVSGIELTQGFDVRDCKGLVRFQGCSTAAPVDEVGPPPGTEYWQWADCGIGLSRHTITNCRGATFVDCNFVGAAGVSPPDPQVGSWDAAPGHHGLLVENSDVALYGCTLVGGAGGDAIASGHFSVFAGAGGDGLRLLGSEATARLCDVQALGGAGGAWQPSGNGDFGVVYGCDGVDVRADAGSAADGCTHSPLSFDAPAILRSGLPETITIEGPVGVPVFLLASPEPYWRPLPTSIGILHLAVPLQLTSLGKIPGSGVLNWDLVDSGPALPNEFVSLQLQVFAVENGARFLSPPRRVVVIDPGL